ncbi:exported hypothetical protein [Cupriavidus taiwanensis]|nr:exported hypothetical protein [Cupriavidus taiwanensis]
MLVQAGVAAGRAVVFAGAGGLAAGEWADAVSVDGAAVEVARGGGVAGYAGCYGVSVWDSLALRSVVVLGGRCCFAGVAGDLLSVRATERRQRARRLSGWLRRCWWFWRW